MLKPRVTPVSIEKIEQLNRQSGDDLLVVEEPLEIRLGYGLMGSRSQKSLAVTMRTPGNDLELSAGFLWTEGLIQNQSDILSIKHCRDEGKDKNHGNVVRVEMIPELEVDLSSLERNFFASSSCGICGKASIESVHNAGCRMIVPNGMVIPANLIHALPDQLREAQSVFKHTGGLHAAALFDSAGNLILMREDVGRHNAVDKVVGAAIQGALFPLNNLILMVSGRAGFELVQKAVMAGIPMMAAVGAPSSLAVSLANEFGMTLCGFVRGNRFNIYAGKDRIVLG